MVPTLHMHLTFLILFGICIQYALLSLPCNRDLYAITSRTRNFLCVIFKVVCCSVFRITFVSINLRLIVRKPNAEILTNLL